MSQLVWMPRGHAGPPTPDLDGASIGVHVVELARSLAWLRLAGPASLRGRQRRLPSPPPLNPLLLHRLAGAEQRSRQVHPEPGAQDGLSLRAEIDLALAP